VLAVVEAALVVAGSVWLLGLAQRLLTFEGALASASQRVAFAAYLLQVPVLLSLEIAMLRCRVNSGWAGCLSSGPRFVECCSTAGHQRS
jgi:hypothetical protein